MAEGIGRKFIAFNGAMSVGKTTQAELFAQQTGSQLLLGEESADPDIVSGAVFTQGSSISTEKWFVDFHTAKLMPFRENLPERGLAADMSLPNDLIWARALLHGTDLQEFETYYREQRQTVPRPDLALLFLLPPEVLLSRVHERITADPNRNFESGTTVEFINKIQDSFITSSQELGDKVAIVDLRSEPCAPRETVQRAVGHMVAQTLGINV